MLQTSFGRRTFRQTAGAVGAVALIALGATPATADAPTVSLVLGKIDPLDGLKPDSTVEVPATFTNAGTEALDKVFLSYETTRGLSHAELPSNCLRYEIPSYDEAPSHSMAVCEFDQKIEPGTVYAPDRTWTLKVGKQALRDRLRVVVSTEFAGTGDAEVDPVPGTGPALKLVEQPDATPATSGGHGDWDAADVDVTSDNTADFQVTGGQLKGAVGDVVDLKVKFTNAGPGWVLRDPGKGAAEVLVDLPAGTTVTKGAGYCTKKSAGSYSCGTSQSWVNENGGETYDFKVRIDKKVAGAEGSVSFGGKSRPFDKVPANDTAPITVDVTGSGSSSTGGSATTGGSSATPSASASSATGGSASSTGGSGSTGGDSATTGGANTDTTVTGDLASTGSGNALPLVGAAVAVVGLGAGTVLLARRRATRS